MSRSGKGSREAALAAVAQTEHAFQYANRTFWGDWEITQSSHQHTRLDSRTAQFTVTLGPDTHNPAEGRVTGINIIK